MVDHKFTGAIEDLVDLFLRGHNIYGPWWEHVDEFLSLPNVHVIQYETLLEKPFETIKSLSVFLERNYSDEQIAQLLVETSFANMKKNVDLDIPFLAQLNVYEKDMDFFKRGQIGSWRNYFTDKLVKKLDDAIKANLKSSITLNYGN